MSIDWDSIQWYSRGRAVGATAAGPSVAVNKTGKVVLNEEALKLFTNVPESVTFGIHQGSRVKLSFIIAAANKGDAGALAVSKLGSKYTINTVKFLKDNKLESMFGSAVAVKIDHDEKHDALVVGI